MAALTPVVPVRAEPLALNLQPSGSVDRGAAQRWIASLQERWSGSRRFRVHPSGRPLELEVLDPVRPVWVWQDGGGGTWMAMARVTWTRAVGAEGDSPGGGGGRFEARGPAPADVERELQRQFFDALEADLRRWFPVRGRLRERAPDGAWILGDALDGAWEPGMVLTIAGSDGLARLRIREDGLGEAIARPEAWRPGLEVQESIETAAASALWVTLTTSGLPGCELAWRHGLAGWAPVFALEAGEGPGLVALGRQSMPLGGGLGSWEAGLAGRLHGQRDAPARSLEARLGFAWMHDLGRPSLWGRIRVIGTVPVASTRSAGPGDLAPEVGLGFVF
ncbi:MAG: hypothetical protein VKP72_09990 [bacterium]|nr:hypothetical protein [bacterium]